MSKINGNIFGTATLVEYGEDERGYLICYAEGDHGRAFAASRSSDQAIHAAVQAVTFGTLEGVDNTKVGVSTSWERTGETTQEQAIASLAYYEVEAAISREYNAQNIDDEQAEVLYDRLGHIPAFPVENQVRNYTELSRDAFNLGKAKWDWAMRTLAERHREAMTNRDATSVARYFNALNTVRKIQERNGNQTARQADARMVQLAHELHIDQFLLTSQDR